MKKGRTIASSVTLVVLIGLSGACGGSSKSFTAAQKELQQQEQAAAAAKAKIAARKQAAAVRKQAEARRKAAMAARLAENRRRALAASTSTTTGPAPTSSTTPPTTSPSDPPATDPPASDPPAANPQADLAVIQDALEDLNAAFRASVAAGITHSETINYWVATGVYTGRQCAAFEAAQGGGVIRESLSVQPGSFTADPGWIDPVVGSKPGGRVYRLVATNVQTLVTTGERRTVSVPLHVTVRPDGQALLFLRCR